MTGGPVSTTLASTSASSSNGADSDEYDTVGGLVYHLVGGIPSVGDVVEVDGLTLTVETTDGRRVGKVLVVKKTAEEEEAQVAAES